VPVAVDDGVGFGSRTARRACLALLAVSSVFAAALPGSARAQEVTVFPANPDVANCYPFGEGHNMDPVNDWTPYMAFFYKNLPPFELSAGEALAFDLGGENDADVQLDIALAPATTNGGDVAAQPFQTVVTNTQTPASPRGDTIVGNFDLRFAAESPFSFAGGGLIIRFSNPSASYLLDDTCTQTVVGALSSDPSGFFAGRAFTDADGEAPWDQETPDAVGAFQIGTAAPPEEPEPVDTAPPETTITRQPKDKTKKKSATFEFSSSEPGSTFECSLDGGAFTSCTSPDTLKVKTGKHSFAVRSRDAAGNLDGSPATDDWKVKKKKK
jgi:hypothetical protein